MLLLEYRHFHHDAVQIRSESIDTQARRITIGAERDTCLMIERTPSGQSRSTHFIMVSGLLDVDGAFMNSGSSWGMNELIGGSFAVGANVAWAR